MTFTNEPIDLNHLPKHEFVELSKPHHNYWNIIMINIFIFLLVVALGITILIFSEPALKAQLALFIGGWLLLAIMLFLLYRASFKKRGYALREKDIIYKSGIIAETTTIVPLNRIQHVALDEGLFSRMFKLGKLQIYTAGGHSGHMMIAGIEIEKARSIRELLLKKLDQLEETAHA